MRTYIVLGNWTDQGIRNIKDMRKREAALRALCERVGGKVREVFRTMGRYAWVFIIDAPDDETMSAFVLALGSGRNSRSETLRAFSPQEVDSIPSRLP